MLYEAEGGNLTFAAAGDFIITRKLQAFREERFLKLRDLLWSADARFSNLEMLFHRWESGSVEQLGTAMASDPSNLEELKWMGFQMVSTANNHSFDFGESGLLANMSNVDAAGLVYSGTGRNLSEARAPAYLETPNGRVALLSVTTSAFLPEVARAGDQRPDMQGRPGTSVLRHKPTYVVDRDFLDSLRRASEMLDMETEKTHWRRSGYIGEIPDDTDTQFNFMGQQFALGKEWGVKTAPHQQDMEDTLRWVREARRTADWVVLSLHNHERGSTLKTPPEFVQASARRWIDEGVDVVVGHGPHLLRGIEIYKSKPIFYSLGNFLFQADTVLKLPQEAYNRFGLGYGATPADFFESRSGTAPNVRGFLADPVYWESVVAMIHFRKGKLDEISLYPLDLGFGRPRSQRGRPLLADQETGTKTLEGLAELSRPFGVEIKIADGKGVVRP